MLHHYISNGLQILVRSLLISRCAAEGCQPLKHIHRNGVASWSRVIHDILGTTNQHLVVVACIEEATVLLVCKQVNCLIYQGMRFRKPANVKAGLIERK